jgi:hypothetical protein
MSSKSSSFGIAVISLAGGHFLQSGFGVPA